MSKEEGRYSIESSKANMRQEKQKEYNNKSKMVAKMIGENMLWYVCALIPALLICFIWTETELESFGKNLISDAIITVVLFLIAGNSTAKLGLIGGKMDDEYVSIHTAYLALREKIYGVGIILMDAFCLWQVDVEYDTYMRRRCKKLGITLEEFNEKYRDMPFEDLKNKFGAVKAGKVELLKGIEPIELTPEILLTDGRAGNERGGVSESGEEYFDKKTKDWRNVITTCICAIFTISFSFMMTDDVSFARIVYTVCKLVMLCVRMYTGYSKGARAYNTVEPKHIASKIQYFNLYLEFIEKKIYKSFGNKYGDISFMESDNITADNSDIKTYEEDNRKEETNTCGA